MHTVSDAVFVCSLSAVCFARWLLKFGLAFLVVRVGIHELVALCVYLKVMHACACSFSSSQQLSGAWFVFTWLLLCLACVQIYVCMHHDACDIAPRKLKAAVDVKKKVAPLLHLHTECD